MKIAMTVYFEDGREYRLPSVEMHEDFAQVFQPIDQNPPSFDPVLVSRMRTGNILRNQVFKRILERLGWQLHEFAWKQDSPDTRMPI